MQTRAIQVIVMTIITLLIAPLAQAHTGMQGTSGLADGFMHPVTGFEHLLIAIAAGFWAGRSGNHGVPDMIYFLSLLLGGMLLGAVCLAFPQLQLSTILVVVLIVVFIAANIVAPQYFSYLFFGGFAVYHGIVHILEVPVPTMAAGYIFGLLVSTGLLLMLGLILRQVVVTRKPHSETTP